MIHVYEGATHTEQHVQASLNYTEDFVFCSDEITREVLIWDSRTGQQLQRWRAADNLIRCVCTAPDDNAFITCSDDFRVRYYAPTETGYRS
jgi:cleavage stimulation factor subunit 1